jgi:hypothetical protein
MASEDEPFVRFLRKLRERYAGKEMTLHDLQKTAEEGLPQAAWYDNRKSLEWFFDGWVNGTAIPRIELSDVKVAGKGSNAIVTGTVTLEDAPDDLVTSVPIYGVVGTQTPVFLGRVFADSHKSKFRLPVPPETRRLLLDPYQTILTQ